jgi:hypothetical protein
LLALTIIMNRIENSPRFLALGVTLQVAEKLKPPSF